MAKVDSQNLKLSMYDSELDRFKFDLRNIEKVMVDIYELDNKVREINDIMNETKLDHNKRLLNVSDRQKIFEGVVKNFENEV